MNPKYREYVYQTYNTDERLLEAIETITGGNLACVGGCNNPLCDGIHPEHCSDPAVVLWREGGRQNELMVWLDKKYPEWHVDMKRVPIYWKEG